MSTDQKHTNIRYSATRPLLFLFLLTILYLLIPQHNVPLPLAPLPFLPFILIVLLLRLLLDRRLLLLNATWVEVEIRCRERLILGHINQLVEELFDVLSRFGRHLEVWNPQLLGFLLCLFLGNLSVFQVDLVAYEESEAFSSFVVIVEGNPGLRAVEGGYAGDIDDDEGAFGIFEVVGDEGAESLLTCGVPELQAEVLAPVGDILDEEIDADGRLDQWMGTLLDSSNISFTYFSMMLDFPTDWFPSSTIFNLVLPLIVLTELFIFLFKLQLYQNVFQTQALSSTLFSSIALPPFRHPLFGAVPQFK